MKKIFKATFLICSSIILSSTQTLAVELCGQLSQGEIIRGKFSNAEHIFINGKEISSTPDGFFIFALERDATPEQTLQISYGEDISTYPLNILPTEWDIQKINGIAPRKVTPTDMDNRKIDKERNDLRRALDFHNEVPYWQNGFIMPVKGRTSGAFGGQRIMNGQKKSPHQGMDIAAPENTPVYASSDGIITLSGGDYFYTGNVVVINHGQSLSTIYAHLKSTTVKKGDKIKQGDIIGYVGQTGRATGPHLHWGASLNGIRFQPLSLLKIGDNNFCTNL